MAESEPDMYVICLLDNLRSENNPFNMKYNSCQESLSQYVINGLHMAKYMRPVCQLMALQIQYGQQQCLSLDIYQMLKLNCDQYTW